MKLSLTILAHEMKDYNPITYIAGHDRRNISCIQIGEYREGGSHEMLYVSEMASSDKEKIILCECRYGRISFQGYRLEEILNQLVQIMWRFNDWENKFKELCYRNTKFQAQNVVNLLYEVFNQPIMLFNLQGVLLGVTEKYTDTPVTPGWRLTVRQKRMTQEGADFIYDNSVSEKTQIELVHVLPPFRDYLQFAVFEDFPYAYTVLIYGYENELDGYDIQMAEAVQEISSDFYSKYCLDETMIEDVFLDLLKEDHDSTIWDKSCKNIYRQLSWKTSDNFYIAVAEQKSNPDKNNRKIISEMRHANQRTVIFEKNEQIIFIFPTGVIEDFEKEIKYYMSKYFVGISYPFSDFRDLFVYYRQADCCLLMKEFSSYDQGAVIPIWEHTASIAVHTCNKMCADIGLSSPVYRVLKAYDEENGTQLVSTLYMYLQHGQNMAVTAELLNIHRNTLRNRLIRINDLCAGDDMNFMEDFNSQVFFVISCDVLDNGKFDA